MRAKHRLQFGPVVRSLWGFGLAICLMLAGVAHASVAILLEQPYGGLGTVNPTGHAAIYLDHVCAETPLKLRPCGPGELGAVISRYDGIRGYDWIAVPLIPYLYSVETAAEIPASVDRATATQLRDEYRREHLAEVAPAGFQHQRPDGNWYELVGSAFDRTIYGFQVDTTPQQDAALIAMMNDRPNVERYNGAFRNCADFARITINHFYPHAIRRNFIADFGLTTPKSAARGLAFYAHKHPEVHLRMFVVPQLKGDLPRSHAVEGVTESLLKQYGLPLILLSPTTAGVVLVAYIEHGRFSMPRHAPELDVPALQAAADREVLSRDAVALGREAFELTASDADAGVPPGRAGLAQRLSPAAEPTIPALLTVSVAPAPQGGLDLPPALVRAP